MAVEVMRLDDNAYETFVGCNKLDLMRNFDEGDLLRVKFEDGTDFAGANSKGRGSVVLKKGVGAWDFEVVNATGVGEQVFKVGQIIDGQNSAWNNGSRAMTLNVSYKFYVENQGGQLAINKISGLEKSKKKPAPKPSLAVTQSHAELYANSMASQRAKEDSNLPSGIIGSVIQAVRDFLARFE